MTLCLLSHKEVKEDTCQKKWKTKNKHAESGRLSFVSKNRNENLVPVYTHTSQKQLQDPTVGFVVKKRIHRKASETVSAMLVVQETELRSWLLFTCEGGGGQPFWESLEDFQTNLRIHPTFLELSTHKFYILLIVKQSCFAISVYYLQLLHVHWIIQNLIKMTLR